MPDAHPRGLLKDGAPLPIGEQAFLPFADGVVRPGVAARAAQVAARGDAGDQKGWNVVARLLRPPALFARPAARERVPGQKRAALRIVEGRPQNALDDCLHAFGQVFFEVERFRHP